MLKMKVFLFQLVLSLLTATVQSDYSVEKYSILMPNVRPLLPESYLCTPVKIDTSNTYFIVAFTPNATMHTAHHIILYGCTKPGSSDPLWNCGEMASSDNKIKYSPTCAEGNQIIYAWARDAPSLQLPEGVGFKVGVDSSIKYLVLQVHYADVSQFQDGHTDDSGVILHYTTESLTKQAGVIVLGTGGSIPAHSVEYMETSCPIKQNKTIYPFAYRTHTHSLGKVVSGYVIKHNSSKWIELGKRDPLTPQMFYPVKNFNAIQYNDILAARCTMESHRDRVTVVGNTNKDEMCNFYLMYFVDNDEPLDQKYCFTVGPPFYYWKYMSLPNIPDDEASKLP